MSKLAHYHETNFLRELANAVVALRSVSDDLKAANLDEGELVEAMLNEPELSETIEHAISESVAQADRLKKEIDTLRNETRDFGQTADSHFGEINDSFSPSLSVMCYIAPIALTPSLIVLGALALFPEEVWTFTENLEKALGDLRVWALIIFVWISFPLLGRFMARSPKIASQPARGEPRASRAEIEQRIEKATAGYSALESEIRSIVRDKVLTPVARMILEREVKRSYEPILQGTAAPLGEVFDPRFETETKSRKELEQLFSAMSGGSIGIAGSRGSGKTTLINYFCRRSDGSWRPRDRPVLAFSTPAPTRYDARDFVLHLFATLCQTVLAAVGESFVPENGSRRTQSYRPALLALLPYTRAMSILGSLILWASAIVFGLCTAAILSPDNAWLKWVTNIFAQLSHTLGLNLGACFLVGGVLWLIGGWARRIEVIMRQEAGRRSEIPKNVGNPELSREAGKHLGMIRFQRNFTSGWSGTLSLPFSLAGSATEAESLAERQESLPEIIDRYRKFVSRVKSDYTVVIGIDELDKLKSDEDAERFLNDNKVLFGLEGCFYLVSISESALARFERRGLPLRDTFDSSFDEVLHVGYLNTAKAITLLRRRVARLPVPFGCFCNCLAGGLPRDIIRVCRSLYVTAEETKERSLHELSHALVRRDFYHKCRAMALSAKLLDTDYASDFLIALNRLEDVGPTVEQFDEGARFFFESPKLPRKPSEDDRRLAALCKEFGSYLLYCATLLAFFGDQLNALAIQKAENDGLFDQLSKARQSMTVDPKLSWYLCIAFRKKMGLPCPSLEAEPQLVAAKVALI